MPEVNYWTNACILLVKIIVCSKFHCPNVAEDHSGARNLNDEDSVFRGRDRVPGVEELRPLLVLLRAVVTVSTVRKAISNRQKPSAIVSNRHQPSVVTVSTVSNRQQARPRPGAMSRRAAAAARAARAAQSSRYTVSNCQQLSSSVINRQQPSSTDSKADARAAQSSRYRQHSQPPSSSVSKADASAAQSSRHRQHSQQGRCEQRELGQCVLLSK